MAVSGYARVSTTDRNLDLQSTALRAVGAAPAVPGNGVSGSTVKRPRLSASASWTSSRTSGNRVQVSDPSWRTRTRFRTKIQL
ncbi:recombinase family protein [Arthrobacter sp. 92]|uniref:recombinase family protein n=1 Tax=Arthrobacter sp. 92 TaxID=3418175 RepID=UPI003D07714F